MRKRQLNAAALGLLLAVPAMALAGDSTTYEGNALGDPDAKIELKITDGANRDVLKVVAKGLPYTASDLCGISGGRTPKATLKGDFNVKDNGSFRAIGAAETNDLLTNGELKVIGTATRRKVTGDMKFTFGKTGCESEKVEFKATR